MNVFQKPFRMFLTQPITFTIPVYQRNYDWKKENCKRLFFDTLNIVNNDKEFHFLGSVCHKTTSLYETVIIDGQQRITSTMLFIKALHDVSKDEMFKEQVRDQYLVNKYSLEPCKVKLKPIEYDRNIYQKLIEDIKFSDEDFTDDEKDTNVFINYNYFKSLILENLSEEITDRKLMSAIERLSIVEIELTTENPQVIFESLNSTGLDLSAADLLRNYCLMSLDYTEQERLYKEYWSKIEKNVTPKSLEQFMVHYLIFKRKSVFTVNNEGKNAKIGVGNLYQSYKKQYPGLNNNDLSLTETLLSDMYKYSCIYKNFIINDISMPKTNLEQSLFVIFKWFEQKDASIILMYLFDLYNESKINQDTLNEALNYVITLIFRSKVCSKKGPNQQSAISYVVKMEEALKENATIFDNDEKINNDFIKILLNALTSLNGDYAFPLDEEFKDTLMKKDLYNSLKSKGCKYLFYSIESSSNKECPDLDKQSIEHIMPQKLSKEWIEYLDGFSDRQNHEKLLHTLGNLTLTGYNSELSNDEFDIKKEKYKDSSYVNITRTIAKYPKWTSKQILKRAEELADKALEIWSLPEEYQNNEEISESYNLESNFETLKGTKPNSVNVFGKEIKVTNWNDLQKIVIDEIYDLDSDTFMELISREKVEKSGMKFIENVVVDTPTIEHPFYKKADNLFVYENSGPRVLKTINYIIEYFDRTQNAGLADEIEFTIKNDSEENERKTSPFRFDKAGIPVGSTLTFIKDDSITVTTVDDRTHVLYKGKEMSLSQCAAEIMGFKNWPAGPHFFKYNDEVLSDIRQKLGF